MGNANTMGHVLVCVYAKYYENGWKGWQVLSVGPHAKSLTCMRLVIHRRQISCFSCLEGEETGVERSYLIGSRSILTKQHNLSMKQELSLQRQAHNNFKRAERAETSRETGMWSRD